MPSARTGPRQLHALEALWPIGFSRSSVRPAGCVTFVLPFPSSSAWFLLFLRALEPRLGIGPAATHNGQDDPGCFVGQSDGRDLGGSSCQELAQPRSPRAV